MTTDMRAQLTVTADASALVAEMRRGSEGLRELKRETDAAAAAAARAATEQGRMAAQLDRTFNNFGANRKSARDSFGAFDATREYEAFRREQAQQAARSYQALAASLDPVTRAQRELAQSQAVVNRALEQGQVTNTEAERTLRQLETRYQQFIRSHSTAAQSAAAMERAIESEADAFRQMTLSLDPAIRAQTELQRAQELTARAVRHGITTQEEANRIMGLFEARQRQVGAGGVTMGMGVQNASYQLADFAVQVQAGQAASLALAQQLPQLLGGFGVLGAVLGAVVAVGVPLVKVLFDTEDAAKAADERMKQLEASTLRLRDSLELLRDQDLSLKFGNLTDSMREAREAMLALDRASQLKTLRTNLDGLLTQNDPGFWSRFGTGLLNPGIASSTAHRDEVLNRLNENTFSEYGSAIGFDEFNSRRGRIDELLGMGDAKAAIEEVNALIVALTGNGSLPEVNAELRDLLDRLTEIGEEAGEVEAQFNGTADAAKVWSGIITAAQSVWDQAIEKAKEQRAEGEERLRIAQDELSLAQAAAQYGEDSKQAEAERARIARDNYEVELERAGIFEQQRQQLMDAYDETQRIEQLSGDWADRMAEVRSEIGGILSSLASLGGSVVERAARAAELQALNAGETVADAAARGAAVKREAEQRARLMAASGPFGQITARVQNWWQDGGVDQNAQLEAARDAARQREREANRRARGRRGAGDRSSASAGASIMQELARLAPSYENDVAAANAWREKALEGLNKTRDGYEKFAGDVETIYQERLQKAYEDDLKRRDDWAAGVERGLLQVEDDLGTWADAAENLVTGWAKKGEEAFVRLGMTGKVSIGDMVDFMLEQFLRLAYQQNIAPGMNMLMNTAVNWVGSFLPGGAGAAAPVSTNHTGSPGVMRSYALPGFGDRMRPDEKLAMIRDGEEVLTSRALENAGALISNLSALASQSGGPAAVAVQTPPMQVTVHNYSDSQVSTEQNSDNRGNPTLTMTVGRQVAGAIGQQGNPAGRAIESRYGVRQQGIPR